MSELVYRSGFLLVKILGFGEVERFFLVCSCGVISEDGVVWMVFFVFWSSFVFCVLYCFRF